MYAADHEKLFEAPTAAPLGPLPRVSDIDLEALTALGRRERARQFARLFDKAAAAIKRLVH